MPRRVGPFIHQVYIADGFADDCDELIHRCTQVDRVDYHHFCKIWKEMKMGCVYEGRTLGAEIAELSEELIHIAKHYMLKDTSNFEETAIGVFIVYALLHLQPYKGFANLRIVPEDLPAINRIERVARRDKRYDVLYALGSVTIKGPVQYHAAEREYGMDLPVRKYLEGFTSIDKLGVRPKGVFRRQNEELDILKELHILIQRYTQAKMMISERAQFDRNLQYINPNFPKELETALMKLITGIHEDKYGSIGESSSSKSQGDDKVLQSRRAIKEKAMQGEVKPVRHLVQLKNRKTRGLNKTNKAGPSKATDEQSKDQIAKNKNAVKVPTKRRISISPRAVKRNRFKTKLKKHKKSSSNSDESDSDVIELSEDESEEDVSDSITSSETVKSTADAKNKGKGKKTMVKENNKEEQKEKKAIKNEDNEKRQNEETNDATILTENETEDEQELDIEIDTLPVLIRTEEQGRLFEIEIIDNQAPIEKNLATKKPVVTYKKRKDCLLKKINAMPGISLEKIPDTSEKDPVPSTSWLQLATITEIAGENKSKDAKAPQEKPVLGTPNSKIEKRGCKRVHLQSKLKRLGMLPIANFNTPEPEGTDENENDSNDGTQNKGLERIDD